jgi:hypothetical protein
MGVKRLSYQFGVFAPNGATVENNNNNNKR